MGTERAFGVAINARQLDRDNQGKHAIYTSAPEGPPGTQDLYVRLHCSFGPGEQRKYGYDFKVCVEWGEGGRLL
jgi:hypothetical protein